MKNKARKKVKNSSGLDELALKKIGETATISMVFTIFYLLVDISYHYIKTQDISQSSWSLVLLLLNALIFYLGTRSLKEASLPTRLGGQRLPLGQDWPSRKSRLKAYLLEALLASGSITGLHLAFNLLGVEEAWKLSHYLLTCLGFFLIFFLLRTFFAERSIRSYLAYMDWLED